MNHLIRKYVGLLLILLTAASCGVGDTSDRDAGGGIGGTGISKGTITGFGSVVVNGVAFNTTGSPISVDDNPGIESDLAIGMVVTVQGTINDDGTGTASSVTFEDNLEGPISSIDPAAKTLEVLGQTVVWNDSAKFESHDGNPTDPNTLIPGNIIEVSGFASSGGVIQATRIEKKADAFTSGMEIELKGTISNLNTINNTFTIGLLTVNYSSAQIDDSLGALSNGLFVEVKSSQALADGVLIASKVEGESEGVSGSSGSEVELEGLVTFFDPLNPTNFEVNGQPVQTSSSTEFENGSSDDLALNVHLEAEGTLNASGVLVATKIEFRHTRVRIEASVDAVDPANNTITFFLTADNSVVVTVNALSEMEDDNGDPLSLNAVVAGDWLEIKAYAVRDSSGVITEIIATELEREDPPSNGRVILRGPVSEASNPTLVILGVTVDTAGDPSFQDINENLITRAEFFSQIGTQLAAGANPIVKAKGDWTGTQIDAKELEIED